jgi:hypothetical protein
MLPLGLYLVLWAANSVPMTEKLTILQKLLCHTLGIPHQSSAYVDE